MPGMPRPAAVGFRGRCSLAPFGPGDLPGRLGAQLSHLLGSHPHATLLAPGTSLLQLKEGLSGLPCLQPRSQGPGLPRRQEALGPAPGGLASREAWPVIRVAMRPPVAAPQWGGLCLEAEPGWGHWSHLRWPT